MSDGDSAAFAPYEGWADLLLAETPAGDASHDRSHLVRVWRNAVAIMSAEGGDAEILAVAVLLHDCVAVEKDSPLRSKASHMAAERASSVLAGRMEPDRIAAVAHAVEAHSFSGGVEPGSLEARILRDADRLDQIGAVGIGRVFFVGGRIGRALYHPGDPRAETRELDDVAYTMDHFRTKLLHVHETFVTAKGREMAEGRAARTRAFVEWFEEEIGLGADPG